MALTSSMEDYLEAVFMLQKRKGYARCTDVAEHLGVKKPSVSRAVKELSKMGYLLKEADGTLSCSAAIRLAPSVARARRAAPTVRLALVVLAGAALEAASAAEAVSGAAVLAAAVDAAAAPEDCNISQ